MISGTKGRPAQRSRSVQLLCATLAALVLSWWAKAEDAGQQQLALALDASTLSDRFTVLCISVLYRGCAIPMAWAIVPAWGKGAWKPIWLDLFDLLAESVPIEEEAYEHEFHESELLAFRRNHMFNSPVN